MSSETGKRNFKEWKPAAVAIICGFCVWASGCGQRAAQDPAEAELRKLGKVQDSGCEDDLTDIFFIHSATLPPGAAAPSPDGARAGFAVGAAHTLLKTDNGGASWRRVFPRNPDKDAPVFESVMFGSSTEGWAVSRSLLLHTADGGETWTPASKLPGNFYYFGPASVTATHYYQMQPPTCAASVWRTADGGNTWNTLPATLPHNDYQAVFFLNDSLGWVAGDRSRLALTQDGGETWTDHQLPGDLDLVQIQFVTPAKGWLRPVYATEGGLLASIDGGRTWNPCHTGLAGRTETLDMRFLDENTGFLLARAGQDQVRLLRTLDGGGHWTAVAELPVEMTALCFASPREGWLAGPKGRILHLQLN